MSLWTSVTYLFCWSCPFHTCINEWLLLVFTTNIVMITILTLMISCIFIIAAILRFCSASDKNKDFSTCAHPYHTAVTFFCLYQLQLHSTKLSLLLRTKEVGVCILYPGDSHVELTDLYSLRNKEIKDTMKRLVEIKCFSCWFITMRQEILI